MYIASLKTWHYLLFSAHSDYLYYYWQLFSDMIWNIATADSDFLSIQARIQNTTEKNNFQIESFLKNSRSLYDVNLIFPSYCYFTFCNPTFSNLLQFWEYLINVIQLWWPRCHIIQVHSCCNQTSNFHLTSYIIWLMK